MWQNIYVIRYIVSAVLCCMIIETHLSNLLFTFLTISLY